MNFQNRDILSIRDFSREELLFVLDKAAEFEHGTHQNLLDGTVMASLFFEPSTRTRLSFESSMNQLGGKVIGFSDTGATSISKGETLWDTIKMVEGYTNVIVMRHHKEGAARLAAEATDRPVINAGDGSNQHPTQTFTDLYTLKKEFGDLKKVKIGFVGDLKYGRTVHSLALALSAFKLPMSFISPKSLRMPDELLDEIRATGTQFSEETSVEKVLPDINVLYVTRIQKERFSDQLEYERLKGVYQVDSDMMKINPNVKVMHPLPRVNEISTAIDATENAIYFKQAHNGIPVRKALLSLVLGRTK